MEENPRFTSDPRSPTEATWTDDEDWLAGTILNAEVNNGVLIGQGGPELVYEFTWTIDTWSGNDDRTWRLYRSGVPHPTGERGIRMEVTQNIDHAPNEAVDVEMGLLSHTDSRTRIDAISRSVTFDESTTAGTTKTRTATGNLQSSHHWCLFLKLTSASTTTSIPEPMDLVARVGYY